MPFTDELKLRNIFSQLFKPDANPNAPMSNQVQSPDMGSNAPLSGDFQIDQIRKKYGIPSDATTAQDQLHQMVLNPPNRADMMPGTGRKILAGIASLGAIQPGDYYRGQPIGMKTDPLAMEKIYDSIAYKKYNDAEKDYNARLKPLGELADAERSANTNTRLMTSTVIRDENADQEHERKVAKDASDAQIKKDQLDERYYFAGLKEQALYQPNVVQFMDDNGKLYTLDKKSGDIKPTVNPLTGEQMNGSKLPQAEQMKLKQNNDLALVAARGSQARQTVAAQGEKEVDVSGKTKQDKIDVKAATPGKNTAPVEGSGSGKKPVQQGTVRMIAPDGKTHGTLPASKLKEYLAKGYKVE